MEGELRGSDGWSTREVRMSKGGEFEEEWGRVVM